MNTDIRLSVGFWQHPKTRKTAKRLGLEGVRSLQILWLWAAINRPDGNLSGMDWEDIELAADWQGEEQSFFDFCMGIWIDDAPQGYVLHDWKDHNSWASEADERSDKARFSRLATVNREAYDQMKAAGINAVSKDDYDRLTTVQRPSDDRPTTVGRNVNAPPTPAPAPSPALTHKDKEGGDNARACDVPAVLEANPDDPSPAQGVPKRTDCPSKGNPQWRGFLSCWQVYPVQQGKEAAWCEWMRLHGNGTLAEAYAIRDAILLLAQEDSRWLRGKVPNMAKWLNAKGWDDQPFKEPEAAPGTTPRDGPPVARTQAQRNKQNLEGLAAFANAAGRRIADHGYGTNSRIGIEHDGGSLPAPSGR